MSDNDIPVSDSFQPVPGVEYGDKLAEQATVVEPTTPAIEQAPEKTVEPEKTDNPAQPAEAPSEAPTRDERGKFKKATPIANLLSKKHELETQLETERAEKAELQRKIEELSTATETNQTSDKIQFLAEKHGIDPEVLSDIVSTAREGIGELPKEVTELIEERRAQSEHMAEMEAFEQRYKSVASTFKGEPFEDSKVKEKLLQLAYSTEKAPDGIPYFQKELTELYFGYIKPEIEPGRKSAESSIGGGQETKMLDFEEIAMRDDPKDIQAMDSATFGKYSQWLSDWQGKTPLRRK